MTKRRSELTEATLAVLGADNEFAAAPCVHLASTGARLLLLGNDEARLLELDVELSQSELHRLKASQGPDADAHWLTQEEPALAGVVLFTTRPPEPETCRKLLEPIAAHCPRAQSAVVVHATRPDASSPAQAPELLELNVGALRVSWLSASNVVPAELLRPFDVKAKDDEQKRRALLAELFGGAPPEVVFTSRDLGLLVETLLGTFTRFSRGRHFTFDGRPRGLRAIES